MSPRIRTFSFILIFISLNQGIALCQTAGFGNSQSPVSSTKESASTGGTNSLLNTLLKIASANGVLPNVLPAIQKIFPECQNIVINEGIPQPLPPEAPGRSCKQCSPNVIVTPQNSLPPLSQSYPYTDTSRLLCNEGISGDVTNTRPCPQCLTSNLVVTSPTSSYPISQLNLLMPNSNRLPFCPCLPQYQMPSVLPTQPTFVAPPFIPQAPQTLPQISIIDQNYNPFSSVPVVGPLACQPAAQYDFYSPNYNLQPEIIQPQYNLQIPQMLPPTLPNTAPSLSILPTSPQNVGSWLCSPESNIEPISNSEPIEVPVTNVVSNTDTVANCGQQLPLPISLQISMPAPIMPEPIITVISTSAPAPDYSPPSFNAPYPMPPIHVAQKSGSKWKTLLPILLLALLNGGCGNCGGGCSGCQCGSNIPIPYPIPIPTNNPIISSGC